MTESVVPVEGSQGPEVVLRTETPNRLFRTASKWAARRTRPTQPSDCDRHQVAMPTCAARTLRRSTTRLGRSAAAAIPVTPSAEAAHYHLVQRRFLGPARCGTPGRTERPTCGGKATVARPRGALGVRREPGEVHAMKASLNACARCCTSSRARPWLS